MERPREVAFTQREPNAPHVSETREPWIVRDYVPEDEACVVATWLKGYAHAREVADTGLRDAGVDGSPDEIRFWRIHQPIVTALLGSARIRVVCDPQRSTYDDGHPAVIWAWACVDDDSVHWVMVKRSAIKAGLGEDLVRALLGDRLEREQRTTFELVDVARLRLIPKAWKRDRGWLAALRSLSTRMLDGDRAFAAIGNHVLDVHRRAWRASSERDAA